MTEVLVANPVEIAGLGNLADEIGTRTLTSHRYLLDHAGFDSGIQGLLLQRLAPFLASYRDFTRDRHVHLASNCCYIGDELKKAAWLYDDLEKQNYDSLNAHVDLAPYPASDPGNSDTAAEGSVQDYYSATEYGEPVGIDYPPPAPAIDDTREALQAAAASLGELDHWIYSQFEWSPLSDAIIPLTGNWNEIRRVGDAFLIAGQAMESAGIALESGTTRVDEFWNGLAAQAFSTYSSNSSAAMRWEGPCGRTIGEISQVLTDEIRESVQSVVRKIAEMVEAEVDVTDGKNFMKIAFKKVPGLGTTWQVYDIGRIIKNAVDSMRGILREIEEVIDAFGQFLEAISDPMAQVDQKIDQYLAPLNEFIDTVEITGDAVLTADIGPVLGTPDERFSVGEGDAPWRDA